MLGFKRRKVYNFFMQRIKLVLEYNGKNFSGWQRQKSRRSVQGEVENALSKLLQTPVLIVGSSRTDAKVHAFGQRAISEFRPLNSILPEDVKVVSSSKGECKL